MQSVVWWIREASSRWLAVEVESYLSGYAVSRAAYVMHFPQGARFEPGRTYCTPWVALM